MSTKTPNQKAWWLVLPVVVLVAFNAVLPLMTVVNYSVQETFGENVFFFEGVKWFEQILHSKRFHESLQRQLLYTAIVLAIEVPLGVAIALAMPVILWQIWQFVSPGLYKHERRYALPFVGSAIVLFIMGAYIAYWTLPKALQWLADIGGNNITQALSKLVIPPKNAKAGAKSIGLGERKLALAR